MGQLIDDLLTLSRVTRSEMHGTRVDMSRLAHTILSELRKSQAERTVEVVIAPGLLVHADVNLLRIARKTLRLPLLAAGGNEGLW
jgi:light-regulated signal transduction histidine kinase (bacteriophytochrome)